MTDSLSVKQTDISSVQYFQYSFH